MYRKILWGFAIFMTLIGIALLVYPGAANYINQYFSYQVISDYEDTIAAADEVEMNQLLQTAFAYNETLPRAFPADPFTGENIRNLTDTGFENFRMIQEGALLGYIEIPSIDVYLPMYYGTEDEVLKEAVGLVDNTSLPVGGNGSHAVISGHTGLSSRKIFTDLNLMKKGDLFFIHILNRHFAYQVDQIKVVLPTELEDLMIVKDKELVTLLTCTPFGVNDHRLLVRGSRIAYDFESAVPEEAAQNIPSNVPGIALWIFVFFAVAFAVLVTGILIYRSILRRKALKKALLWIEGTASTGESNNIDSGG